MTNKNIISTEAFKTNQYNEQYLYSVNRHTFEKESSASVYKRHYSETLSKEESLYLIFGTDSGLLTKHIIQQELPKNTRYLFIELPQLIEKIKETLPKEYDNESFNFATPDNWKEVAEEMEISLYIYKDKVRYIKSLAALDSFITDYHTTNAEIIKSLEILFFFTRALVGVFPFMTKQLMNIADNKHSSARLNSVFEGKTCVILGGGPSLDEDIEWIKANQKNVVIIAASRIARSLLKYQVTPHIIVSVDPYDVSFDVSKELLKLPKEVLFLQGNCVTPGLLSQWHGKNAYIGARFPWDEESDENCSIMGGPTVTNTALKAAVEMGFSNILLSGVDMCYAKNGVTHATGSNEANVGPTLGQPGIWVETYAGNKAETMIAFDNAVHALSKQALEALDLGINIYNLSENAAKAKYIDHVPSSALSFENEEDNIWQLIDEKIPDYTAEFIRQDNNFVLEKVSKRLKEIQEIKILAEESLLCNEKLFKEKGKESENFKYKLRMDKIEKKLDAKYKKSTRFIKNFGLDKFIKSAQTSHDDWSDEKIEETGRLYYQAYIDSSTTLIKLLKETRIRIKSRVEEEKQKPNLDLLLDQWTTDKQFGRAKVWQENSRHQAVEISSEFEQKFIDCIEQFNQVLASKDTAHLTRTKQHSSLLGVKRKIVILFHQHNIDGLQAMVTSLNLYKNKNEQVEELLLLANAYLSVHNKDVELALEFFEQLPKDKILEDELQQIASLSIKITQYEKAELALKKLANLSDIYAPKYAKILKLMGKPNEAIDIYSRYLSENPKDIQTWCSLGKLYVDINSFESAQLAFQYVLAQEPTHIEAQESLNKLAMTATKQE